jgi:hypothetical protein
MSLTVSPDLLARAQSGQVDDDEFLRCVRDSLPYAYALVADLARQLAAGDVTPGTTFADNRTEPPDEQAWGQLFRAMASDAIRNSLERHFGVRLAFQNCCRAAVFPLDPAADAELEQFISVRAQLLNQSPGMVNC